MRKLSSIQQIVEIRQIDGADSIEAVRNQDWWTVAKKGEFAVGDMCVFFEIDSLLPMIKPFEFLANRGTRKMELEDGTIIEGYRLKSTRLRGQLSQGLAMPISAFSGFGLGWGTNCYKTAPIILGSALQPDGIMGVDQLYEGCTVDDILGIYKYEAPIHSSLAGIARGNFPSFLKKSDQERCQNLRKDIWNAYEENVRFEVTFKLDGASMTVYPEMNLSICEQYDTERRFGICSRNLDLKETEDNSFWKVARQQKLQEKLENGFGHGDIALQGELIGPSIQANFEGVDKLEFYVYNMFDIHYQEFLSADFAYQLCMEMGINYVPILYKSISLRELFPAATEDTIIQNLLDIADGPSAFKGKMREGLVYKSLSNAYPTLSFKTISNRYLLKCEE